MTREKPLPGRRALLAALLLAGCGFTPVYGPGGSAEGLHGEIGIDAPRDAAGFTYVRQLERRLGLADTPRYRLGSELSYTEEELGITSDQVITRYQLVGGARFTLTEIATQEIVATGRVNSFISYSGAGTPVASRAARRDAEERLMVALADQVVSRLLATAGDWR